MEPKFVITITNQFCSKGRVIARRLGELLDIPCYNEQLTQMAADQLGIPPELVQENEERSKRVVGDSLFPMFTRLGDSTNNIQNDIFHTQRKLIKSIAQQENCIIVGRCADFVLSERKDVLNFHIYAPFETRVAHCVAYQHLPWEEAIRMVRQVDEARDAYHLNFTGFLPGDSAHKDLLINSSVLDVEGTAQILAQVVKRHFDLP